MVVAYTVSMAEARRLRRLLHDGPNVARAKGGCAARRGGPKLTKRHRPRQPERHRRRHRNRRCWQVGVVWNASAKVMGRRTFGRSGAPATCVANVARRKAAAAEGDATSVAGEGSADFGCMPLRSLLRVAWPRSLRHHLARRRAQRVLRARARRWAMVEHRLRGWRFGARAPPGRQARR